MGPDEVRDKFAAFKAVFEKAIEGLAKVQYILLFFLLYTVE